MNTITGTGRPSDRTEGNIGDIYIDSNSGNKYECCGIHKITTDKTTCYYIWVRINTAGSGGSDSGGTISGNFVSYGEPQDLTDEQKAQARANISKYEWHTVSGVYATYNIAIYDWSGSNAIDWDLINTVPAVSEYGKSQGVTAFQDMFELIDMLAYNESSDLGYLKDIEASWNALLAAGVFLSSTVYGIHDDGVYCRKLFQINGGNSKQFGIYKNGENGAYDYYICNRPVTKIESHSHIKHFDTTLTKGSCYADAKAVGDALATKISAPVTTDDNGKILQVVDGKWAAVSPSEYGGSTTEQLNTLIETNMLPVVHNADGKILTDEAGRIILRY